MTWKTGRWTTSLAAAALIALPAAGFAQTTPPTTPQQTTPPAAQQPTEPTTAPTPQTGSSGQEAARVHLTAARNTLSQLTQLPAASQLQGETRAHVAELITNFNELITTQANWKEAYEKVEANLASLLNSAPAPAAAAADPAKPVGTSGASASLDPGIRSKLMELRTHLDKFEEAASGKATTPATPPASTAPPAGTTPPTSDTPPTTQTPPTTPTNPAKPDEPAQVNDDQKEQIVNHIDAIEAILSAQATAQANAQTTAGGAVGTSGTASGSTRTTVTGSEVRLTQAQVEQLRNHLAELRRLTAK